MQRYDHSSDMNMGETASKMADLAYDNGESVSVQWGDDQIVAEPGESADDVLTKLETSTDRQATEAGF